ncbi:MAG: helix-turn-helix domain-containing protein [Pseudomonadota bacterium]
MLPNSVKKQFIDRLMETGNVSKTARELGINRMTAYAWREDDHFNDQWEAALEIARQGLRERVIDTACSMGLGEWVPVIDPETGEIELNEHLEPIMRLETSHVDARVLMKLMDKTMRDEVRTVDQRTAVVGQVNHSFENAEVVLIDVDGNQIESEDIELIEEISVQPVIENGEYEDAEEPDCG